MHTLKDLSRPEEVELAQALLLHDLCVGGPLQFVVQVASQVLVGLDNFHIRPINVDRRVWELVAPEVYLRLLRLHWPGSVSTDMGAGKNAIWHVYHMLVPHLTSGQIQDFLNEVPLLILIMLF